MVGLDGRLSKLEQRYPPAGCPRCSPPSGAPRFTFITEDCPPAGPCPACGRKPVEFTIRIGEMDLGVEGAP